MRSTRRGVLVALVAVLALSGIAAASASAAPEWFVKSGGTLSRVTTSMEVGGTINLTVADRKALGEGGEIANKCGGTTEGKIEAGGIGKITKYTASSCETVSGNCHVLSASAKNLPWKTELYVQEGEIRQRILSGGSGTPAWEFHCEVGGGLFDTCNLNSSSNMLNGWGGAVEALFDSQSNRTTCTQGGAEAGQLSGTITFAAPKGTEALEAIEGNPAEWQQGKAALSEAVAITSTGHVTLTDSGVGLAVECSVAGEGTVSPGAAGTTTKAGLSSCVARAGTCKTPALEAVHLPWQTGLYSYGSNGAREVTLSGGSGSPGFRMVCSGITYDVCTGALLQQLTNGIGGVEAAFLGEKLNCTLGGSGKGTVQGEQFIQATKGGTLEVS